MQVYFPSILFTAKKPMLKLEALMKYRLKESKEGLDLDFAHAAVLLMVFLFLFTENDNVLQTFG